MLIRLKRFLAVLLLLLLPLQSTWAMIDSCCNGGIDVQLQQAQQDDASGASQGTEEANCCALCDVCHHASATVAAQHSQLREPALNGAPVPHPDFPLDSFIADVPSRPDRAPLLT